jgi:beta-phosphoglucomutase
VTDRDGCRLAQPERPSRQRREVDVEPSAHRFDRRRRIRPDTVELVRVLARHEVPMAIVTGAQRADVLAVLHNSPAGEFIEVVVAEEDVRRGKPDPEGFLAGASHLDRDPGSVLVFEDSLPGVRGALAAGMRCIAVGAQPGGELLKTAPAIVERLSVAVAGPALPRLSAGRA